MGSDDIGEWNSIDDIEKVVISLIASIIGLFVVGYLAKVRVLSEPRGSGKMISIADSIKIGAKAFLQKEYTYLAVFVCIMLILIGAITQDGRTCVAFVIGAVLSAFCGYAGMLIAVEANVRTAEAAKKSLNDALRISFASGGVMGLSVVCLGSLGLLIVYLIWSGTEQKDTAYLAGFGFGASSIALFARVGGGIYTKAADVGADLVGKVESNIPEDDPRNPATIADNVGDNVGDVAGMGADLFESFVGSIIACIQLSEAAIEQFHDDCKGKNDTLSPTFCDASSDQYKVDREHFIALPFWVSGFGIIAAIIGIFLVRTSHNPNPHELQEHLLGVLRRGIFIAAFLSFGASIVICGIFFGFDSDVCWRLVGCITIGLVGGELIGSFTEYTTSQAYKPTKSIAKKSRIGSAGVVIQGLGIGMLSTTAPVVIIFISILSCVELAGTYGIAIAAVGMLSTLGVTLATDAFGPVSDNAGGIAEMAELEEHVRETTDGLDALGNTTAATGKGFAIGSAVLTSLALLSAYKSEAGLNQGIDVSESEVLASCIFGACLPYIFGALTMMAVGRAAALMISEVLRQFNEYKLLSDKPLQEPDYQQCVAISTQASVIEMIIPGVLAVCGPLFIGFLLGSESLGGMLVGSITSGFMLAVFMANAGGAWDNAKKWVEAGGLGPGKGKKSDNHKAVVVGDTIGDPFKDTSGPALNILIKMMTMISLVFAGDFKKKSYHDDRFWIAIIVGIVFVLIAGSLTYWMRKTGFGKVPKPKEETENVALTQAADIKRLPSQSNADQPVTDGAGASHTDDANNATEVNVPVVVEEENENGNDVNATKDEQHVD